MIFIPAELYRIQDMNPQPDPSVGVFVAFLVMIIMAFFVGQSYAETKKSGHTNTNYDLFTLGYYEQPSAPTVIVNQQPSDSGIANFESQQLYLDCIDTMVSLGYKKTIAKKRAKIIFSTHKPQPSTVQEFLNIVLSRP
jgi:hypothetical protein